MPFFLQRGSPQRGISLENSEQLDRRPKSRYLAPSPWPADIRNEETRRSCCSCGRDQLWWDIFDWGLSRVCDSETVTTLLQVQDPGGNTDVYVRVNLRS